MTMALHFLKRDLCHRWWLYVLWLLVYLGEAYMVLSGVSTTSTFWVSAGQQLLVFPTLHLLVLIVLVSQLVQADPPVGSTAFWLSRPISRASLLVAKVAGLGLVVIIPAIVTTAALSRYGTGFSNLGQIALAIVFHQCAFAVPVAAIAAFTPNFRWSATLAAAIGLLVAIALTVNVSQPTPSFPLDPYAAAALSKTRIVLGEILLILGGGFVFVHQYLTRRTKPSLIFAAGIAAGYVIVAGFWPWSFFANAPLPGKNAPFDLTRLALKIEPGSLSNAATPIRTIRHITGSYTIGGIPPRWFVQIRKTSAQIFLPDGARLKTVDEAPSVPFTSYCSSDLDAQAAALGGIHPYRYQLGSGGSASLASIEAGVFDKVSDHPAKIIDNFDLVAGSYQVAAEIPVTQHHSFEISGHLSAIGEILFRTDGVTLTVVESAVDTCPAIGVQLGTYQRDPRLKGDPFFLLVNRRRREAVPTNPRLGQSSSSGMFFGGMLVKKISRLPFGGAKYPGEPMLDKEWLSDATLVCLQWVPAFEFSKSYEVDLPKLGEPWRKPNRNGR